jgi:hypothetical protein
MGVFTQLSESAGKVPPAGRDPTDAANDPGTGDPVEGSVEMAEIVASRMAAAGSYKAQGGTGAPSLPIQKRKGRGDHTY